eukprot:5807890-Prymnesium_polylepis.1
MRAIVRGHVAHMGATVRGHVGARARAHGSSTPTDGCLMNAERLPNSNDRRTIASCVPPACLLIASCLPPACLLLASRRPQLASMLDSNPHRPLSRVLGTMIDDLGAESLRARIASVDPTP